MAYYSDIVTDDQTLAPRAGVSVTVLTATGGKASLTDAGGAALLNPVTTNTTGAFYFNAPDAVYTLEFRYGGRLVREDEVIVGVPPAFIGPTGQASNVYPTLSTFKASAITQGIAHISGAGTSGGSYKWTPGNFTGKANDFTIVQATGVALTVGAWVRLLSLKPEDFGATGDGVTNDSLAFEAMSNGLKIIGAGVVDLRPGATYIVGRQLPNSGGNRWSTIDVISAVGLATFVLNGNGATLKMAPGLYFGGFDAANIPTTLVPNYNAAQAANQPVLVRVENCGVADIRNINLDGNGAAGIVGGPWSDTGRQCVCYGLYMYNNRAVTVDNAHAFDFLLDGFAYGIPSQSITTAGTPFTFRNCTSKRSGRNCFSLIGGNQPLFQNCTFQDGGYCANAYAGGPGYVISAPASCFDIEAESTEVRNPTFINCQFIGGQRANTAMVSDSGTSYGHHFLKCRFDGNVFVTKPGVVFDRCRIDGKFGALKGGQAVPTDNTQILNCICSDVPFFDARVQTGLFMDSGGSGAGVIIKNSYFYLARTRAWIRGYDVQDTQFTLAFGTTTVADNDYAILADSITGQNVTFIDALGSVANDRPTANGYFILAPGANVRNFKIVSGSGYFLKWNTTSVGGGGYPHAGQTDGSYDMGVDTSQELRIQRNGDFGGGFNGWANWQVKNAQPAIGSYLGGSLVMNGAPTVGGTAAWVPAAGAMQPFGIVGAVRATSVPNAAGATPTAAEFNALITALRTAKLMA